MQHTVGMICFHICSYFYGQREYILAWRNEKYWNRKKIITFPEPFKYHGWKLSAEDLDEEAEDLAAEEEEEEVEEEDENEEVSMLALSIYAFNSFILSLNITPEKSDFAPNFVWSSFSLLTE